MMNCFVWWLFFTSLFFEAICPMLRCSKSQVGMSFFRCNKPQVQVTHAPHVSAETTIFQVWCLRFRACHSTGRELRLKENAGKLLSLRLYSSFVYRIYAEFQVDGPTLLPSIDWFIIAPYDILNIQNQLLGEILCHVLWWWCSLANPWNFPYLPESFGIWKGSSYGTARDEGPQIREVVYFCCYSSSTIKGVSNHHCMPM